MLLRVMVKARLPGSHRGLVQVKRWRVVDGKKPHWTTVWVHPDDLTHEERKHADRVEQHAKVARADAPPEEFVETQLKTDAARVWGLYTNNTYKYGDLPVVACREALQNAVDAIRKAKEGGEIKRGRFEVTHDPTTGELSFEDNGIGMDHSTLHDVFLTLGKSAGKGTGSNAAGGFGVAKAVILGCSPIDEWEIHSRDNFIPSAHLGLRVPRSEQTRAARQGTKITVRGFTGDQTASEKGTGRYVSLKTRLERVLGASTLDDIDLYVNGEKVAPYFKTGRGSAVPPIEESWGKGVARMGLTAFRRAKGEGAGAFYVRINGLLQHISRAEYDTNLEADIVLDMTPAVRPGEENYPLTTSRDEFAGQAYEAFYELRKRFASDAKKDKNDREYDTLLPDSDDASERAAGDQFSRQLSQFFDGVAESQEYGDLLGTISAVERAGDAMSMRRMMQNIADLKKLERHAESRAPGMPEDEDVGGQYQGRSFEKQIEDEVDRQFQEGGGGLAGVLAFQQALTASVGPTETKRLNPFQGAAVVKVSTKNYDKRRAKRFLENPQASMPLLLAWDATCRIIGNEYSFRPFRTGFVLDDSAHALASIEEGGRKFVSINPDSLRSFIKAHQGKPKAAQRVATMLHGLACHELAHLPRMSSGHNEDFSIAREDIALKTAHMMPAIEKAVGEALKLKEPPSEEAKQIAALQRQIASLRAKVAEHEKKQAETRATLAAPPPQLSLFGMRKSAGAKNGTERNAGTGSRSRIEEVRRQAPRDPGHDRGARGDRPRAALRAPAGLGHRAGEPAVVAAPQRARTGGAGGDGGGGARGASASMNQRCRVLVNLRKAQLGLFGGGAPAPEPPKKRAKPAAPPQAPAPAAPGAPKPTGGAEHPPGAGWMPIAASRHGGYHRKKADGSFEYWYPGEGVRGSAKDLADSFELKPQVAGKPKDGSGRRVHTDVGEKVGGAKKDKWAELHAGNLDALEAEGQSEAFKRCTKEAVLGKHDPERDRALGDTAGASLLKAAIYRAVASRPFVPHEVSGDRKDLGAVFSKLFGYGEEPFRADSRAARALYVSAIDKLKKGLDSCRTVKEVEDFLDSVQDLAVNGAYESEEASTEALAKQLEARFPANDGSGANFLYYGEKPEGQPYGQRPHVKLHPTTLRLAGYRIVSQNGKQVVRKLLPKVQDAYRPTCEAVILGERFYKHTLQNRFEGAIRTARYDAIKAEKADDWSKVLPNATGEAPVKKKAPPRFVLTRGHAAPERVGGAPVPKRLDGEAFAQAFGLRAVEYGNWVDDAGASKHLEHAYGALSDLADIMGIEPKQLAHGTTLALAFGARGGGSANAHYESDRKVINLTHTRGGGTLAHEWGHFMDHMMSGGAQKVQKGELRMSGGSHGEVVGMHPDVLPAFQRVMQAIKTAPPGGMAEERARAQAEHSARSVALRAQRAQVSGLRGEERAKAVDDYNAAVKAHNAKGNRIRQIGTTSKFFADAGHLGDYWERPHELFARAFESWAEDRLKARGRANTYLVTDTTRKWNVTKAVNGEEIEGLEPYPAGAEREHINGAIDHLVGVLSRTGALRKALQRAGWLRPIPPGARVHRRVIA